MIAADTLVTWRTPNFPLGTHNFSENISGRIHLLGFGFLIPPCSGH